MISLFEESFNLKPILFPPYPTNILYFEIKTKVGLPKFLKGETFGFHLYGCIKFRGFWRYLFKMRVTIFIASTHKKLVLLDDCIINLTISMMVSFLISTTPFYCREYGVVNSLWHKAQKLLYYLYLVILFNFKIFILKLGYFQLGFFLWI